MADLDGKIGEEQRAGMKETLKGVKTEEADYRAGARLVYVDQLPDVDGDKK